MKGRNRRLRKFQPSLVARNRFGWYHQAMGKPKSEDNEVANDETA